MPKVGDRIVIQGTKLGQSRREGDVLETIGSLMKIRWADGSESLLTPGAGTVSVLTGRSKAAAKATKAKAKAPAKGKTSATAKAKTPAKKPAAKAGKKKR